MSLDRLETEDLRVDVLDQPLPVARVDGALAVLVHLLLQELGRCPDVLGDEVGAGPDKRLLRTYLE